MGTECHLLSWPHKIRFSSVQFSRSVVSDSLRPRDRSTPGLPVHHQLPEFTQTHVHRVSDAIQSSHPLSSPSPPAPSPSQHQSLFQWVNSLHEVVKVAPLYIRFHTLYTFFFSTILMKFEIFSLCNFFQTCMFPIRMSIPEGQARSSPRWCDCAVYLYYWRLLL